jgi:hypothetical protein
MPKHTDPRQLLDEIPLPQRYIFCNVESLRAQVAEMLTPLLTRAQHAHGTGAPWHLPGYSTNIRETVPDELAPSLAALQLLEITPEFIEAKKVIEPLLLAAAEVEKREAQAAQELAAKRQRHADALAAAEQAALAAARKDPAVLAAQAALALVR